MILVHGNKINGESHLQSSQGNSSEYLTILKNLGPREKKII